MSATPPPIVGGETSAAAPAVGVLMARHDETGELRAFCTAGLLSPRAALSAAHCAPAARDYVRAGFRLAFGRGANLDSLVEDIALDGVFVHPAYDPRTLEHDAAVFVLAEDSDAPDVLVPDDSVPEGPEPATLDFIGYGVTGDGRDDAGVRRLVRLPYDGADDRFLYTYDPGGENLCSSDSGAPALLLGADGAARVVGVASFVYAVDATDTFCLGGGAGVTRIDLQRDFLDDVLALDLGGDAGAEPLNGSLEDDFDAGTMSIFPEAEKGGCAAVSAPSGPLPLLLMALVWGCRRAWAPRPD